MYAETDRILSALGRGPFIFNLGHGILKTTRPKHVESFVRHVKSRAA